MAWPVATYNGSRIIPSTSSGEGAASIAALAVAVNQRLVGVDRTPLSFFKADNVTTTTTPTEADIIGSKIHSDSPLKKNVDLIRDGILDLISWATEIGSAGGFVESSGSDTFWTVSSLATEVGGSLYESLFPNRDEVFFQRAQDMLDLLIYYKLTVAEGGGPCTTTHSTPATTYSSFQNAWDNMSTNSPTSYPTSFLAIGGGGATGLRWEASVNGSGPQAGACSSGTLHYDTTGFNGTVVSSEGQVVTGRTYTTGPAWTPTVGGVTLTATPSIQTPELSLSLGSLNTVSCSIAEPATIPERLVLGVPAQWSARLDIPTVIFQVDMSSILTDQA